MEREEFERAVVQCAFQYLEDIGMPVKAANLDEYQIIQTKDTVGLPEKCVVLQRLPYGNGVYNVFVSERSESHDIFGIVIELDAEENLKVNTELSTSTVYTGW